MGVVEKHIESHKKTFDENNIRDFVDLYIAKELEGHTDDETFSRKFNSDNIKKFKNPLRQDKDE